MKLIAYASVVVVSLVTFVAMHGAEWNSAQSDQISKCSKQPRLVKENDGVVLRAGLALLQFARSAQNSKPAPECNFEKKVLLFSNGAVKTFAVLPNGLGYKKIGI